MSNEIVKKNIESLKIKLGTDSIKNQFRNALGAHSDTFMASIIDLYASDSKLQTCDPNAVIMEASKAAIMNLPIIKQLGYGYMLVFNNKTRMPDGSYTKVPTPTFVVGYKGFIQLAERTAQYRTINADVVFEGELKCIDKLTGEITFTGERKSDKIVGYFAYFELLNGFSKTLYTPVEKMAEYAKKYSPSIKFDDKVTIDVLIKASEREPSSYGWVDGFQDMALKTVLRNLLSKYGYLSVEMMNAVSEEDIPNEEPLPKPNVPKIIDIEPLPEQPNDNPY